MIIAAITQLKALNIQASMAFQRMTSAIPIIRTVLYQLSYQANWELVSAGKI